MMYLLKTFYLKMYSSDFCIELCIFKCRAVLESEREGGEGIEALKYLFPSDCDPDDMKNKLVYGVYSLELEK